jgi:hypothetical protein
VSRYGIDVWGWTQEIARRCASQGIAFTVDPKAQCPMTDGKTITVPPLPDNASADDYAIHRGAIIHEVGHVLRPEAFEIVKKERVKPGSTLWACMNICEDAAQERASAEKYRGDRLSLAAMHGAVMRRQIRMANAHTPETVSPEAHKLAAGCAVSLASAADWSHDMAGTATEYVTALDRCLPGLRDLTKELMVEGWSDRMRAARSPLDAWNVAESLHKRLFPEKSDAESRKPADDSDNSEGKEGEGKGDAEGEAEKGEGEGKPVKGVIPWELLMHSEHNQEDLGTVAPSSINWDGKPRAATGGRYYPSQEVKDIRPRAAAIAEAEQLRFPVELVQQVRLLLQARARVRWEHEKLDGRLHRRNLTRVMMPRVGDGTFNRSVFSKKGEALKLDCAVTVLVDSSGSMSGEKYLAASSAAVALYDLCAVALRVPCEVLGFTTSGGGPRYFNFKPYAAPRIDRIQLAAKLRQVQHDHSLAGNADGDAILFAVHRMLPRRETRKILIVLSDGCPADSIGGGDADTNLLSAIKQARATPGIEVYGIGIRDTNVRRYYSPTAPVVNRADEVPAALVTVLRDVLQRKGPV